MRYGTLNHLFSSWVNMGRPDDFCGREQYLKADGHSIYCAGAAYVDKDSLPEAMREKCGDNPAVARVNRNGTGLVVSHLVPIPCLGGSYYNFAVPPVNIGEVTDYPNGYHEPLESARCTEGNQ